MDDDLTDEQWKEIQSTYSRDEILDGIRKWICNDLGLIVPSLDSKELKHATGTTLNYTRVESYYGKEE